MRYIASALAALGSSFRHDRAQRFELDFAKRTIREAYPGLLKQWFDTRISGGLWHSADDQWFDGDAALFSEFVNHIRSRKCVEIGSGPFGFLAPAWWIADRTIIDPLFERYRDYEAELCGASWLSEVRGISKPAEALVPELVGAVDGCIVSRNCLDHCEDPLAVLHAIAQYATPGCWLLLWTDIWHLQGLDEGHHNITREERVMDALVSGLGFRILRHSKKIRQPHEFIEYGCLARKHQS